MSGEKEYDPAPLLLGEGVELLPDVVGERLDQLRVGRPPVDHAPLHLRGRTPTIAKNHLLSFQPFT